MPIKARRRGSKWRVMVTEGGGNTGQRRTETILRAKKADGSKGKATDGGGHATLHKSLRQIEHIDAGD